MFETSPTFLRRILRIFLWVLAVFCVSGIATAVFVNGIYPRLSGLGGFGFLNLRFPVIVNRTEQISIEEGLDITVSYQRVRASLVTVLAYRGSLNPLSGDYAKPQVSSGIIATADGIIFASRQVVGNNPRLQVVLNDGRAYPARIVAEDTRSDLAVLKIEADNLAIAQFGDAYELKAGDRLIAVGPSLAQFSSPVRSTLVVNAVPTPLSYAEVFSADEQHELVAVADSYAVESYGSALSNRDGRVVGLVGNRGVIPGNYLSDSLSRYLKVGNILRGNWGLRYALATPAVAALAQLPRPYGMVLLSALGQPAVESGSAGAESGLREGDFIYKINSEELDATHTFERLASEFFPGDTVTLQLVRAGRDLSFTLILK